MGLVLAQDDSRAQTLLTQSYNYYLTQEHNFALTSYMGPPEEGAAYPHSRQATYTSLILAMLQNAVVSPPAIGGTLVKRWAQELYLDPLPYSTLNQSSYGSVYGNRYFQFASGPDTFEPLASYLLSGTIEGKYLTYFAQQTTGNGGRGDYVNGGGLATGRGANVPIPFIYMPSPANTSQWTDYRTVPTQFIFNQSDTSTCTSLGLECTIGYSWNAGPAGTQYITPRFYVFLLSKRDWTTTATEVQTYAGWSQLGFDHMSAVIPTNIRIYRGAPLLAGDGACNDETTSDTCDTGNGLNDSVIMLGTFNVNNFGGYSGGLYNQNYASVARWGSTEPTGDSSSRYAYEMIDATQAYNSTANPTRVQRSIIHFKKASTQDYVVVYDDMATSSGNLKTAYWHYFVGNGEATESSGSNTVTLTRGTTARLLTSFLAIPGSNSVVMTDEGTSYPGNQGFKNTDRVNICGSSDGATCDSTLTAAEFLTVHLPTTNTSASMPTITQPSCSATGGNCTAVQIEDSSNPKVAVFARQGVTLTAASFTTTHSGTAQYLVAGMVPGNYSVSVNGTTVVSSITVNANDYSLYFESTAGLVQIESSGTLALAITPSFTPAAGTFSSAQAVTITTGTPSATIYYTTNGSTPTTSSAVYSAPIMVSATGTLQAIAVATGYSNSTVGSAAYTISSAAATPNLTPAAGTYSSTQAVTISTTTPSATIYYTTDGSTPTTSSSVYSGPITVSATETVQAIAVASGYSNSTVGSAAYTISSVAATPAFTPAAGTYSSTQTVTISTTTPSATIYYTTNGSTPTTSSAVYSGPISVSATETLQAIAVASGLRIAR